MENRAPIVILAGSLRQPSYSFSLAHAIAASIEALKVPSRLWDFRADPLPFADPEFHHNPEDNPDPAVRRFVAAATQASALVLVTPIYHNAFSGVLKNALDHLTIRQFHLKPVGLASHGGERTTQAVEQLRIVSRGLLGMAITTQVCTARQDFAETPKDGIYPLTNLEIERRIQRFVAELIIMANLLPTARRLLGG